MERIDRQTFELIAGLQQELEDAEDPRYLHRLHCLILVLQGMSAREVAIRFGDPPRSVQRWVKAFMDRGLSGLYDEDRAGRPQALTDEQLVELGVFLRMSPSELGMKENMWDGKILSAFLKHHYGVDLGVRRCQELFHKFEFRLRKPRPEIGGADPDSQRAYKKTQNSPGKRQF